MELILCNPFPHRRCRTHTASHHLQEVVHIVGTRPFLMSYDINLACHLRLLYKLSVCSHSLLSICFGELIRDQSCGVQPCEGDELPAVSELSETLDVGLLLVTGHGSLPVE
jgi:hypothetical protein